MVSTQLELTEPFLEDGPTPATNHRERVVAEDLQIAANILQVGHAIECLQVRVVEDSQATTYAADVRGPPGHDDANEVVNTIAGYMALGEVADIRASLVAATVGACVRVEGAVWVA